MPSDIQQTIFLLGAAGYLGGQFFVLLSRRLPQFRVVALVRNLDADKKAQLTGINHNLTLVEGTLEDVKVVKEQATQAKYVINCASSDHEGSVQAILAGLEEQSANRPGDPPLYIHVSGVGVTSDNARGEFVPEDQIPKYTDIGLDLDKLPPANPHLHCDKVIVAAGTRKDNPVRTAILFPGWIYGIGEGIKKSTIAIRGTAIIYKTIKQAGTWGPGHNAMDYIHVKDCANGLLAIFEAALAGKADTGTEGLYFASSGEPRVTLRDITAVIGDIMFSKGLAIQGSSQPLPPSATDPYGEFGWLLWGGNLGGNAERLRRLGWEATESKQLPLLSSLSQEVEVALQELGF
ncbi:hypothetical protein CPB84DRAFT_1771238 [Gymnopilus junonius]|uniref:NmrA-like domain-containing protein n=1 Tax=Gymnopilus junonius TaxID=109634 RepID=A0A9P5TQ04_GYMJU|nr:hypothetical protein CPB84DRAFT_1771238 [Gymnopilus junonius]